MYRRYGPGIIITITVAPHHAFVIKRIYVGDLNWHRLLLVRFHPSKILHAARPCSQGITTKPESHDLRSDGGLRGLEDRVQISTPGLDHFVRRAWLLQPFQ